MPGQADKSESSVPYASNYVSIHKLAGLNSLEGAEFEIAKPTTPVVTFVLTENIEKYFALRDEREAVAQFLFRDIFGPATASPPFSTIEDAINSQKTRRANKAGKGVFLVILGRQENITNDLPVRNISGYQATLKNSPLEIETIAKTEARSAFASVILSSASDWSSATKKILELSYLEDPQRHRIHIYEVGIGAATLTVSGNFKRENYDNLTQIYKRLEAEASLATPIKLFVEALDAPAEDLRRNLASWASLEILINKIFEQYRSEWDSILRKSVPASGERYFQSVQRIMDGKFNLVDKFAVISSMLDAAGAEEDIEIFRQTKKSRDEFYHALESVPNAELSIRLFRKYLKLHLNKQPVRPISP